jgi:peroxiredoxin
MNKNTLLVLIAFTPFASLFGQAPKKAAAKTFPVKISGTVSNHPGRYIYLHHKWDDKDHTDSAKVVDGKFAFSLKAEEPNMYWFTTMRDLNAQPNYIFFADASPAKATLKGDSIAWSEVTGGQAQFDYMEYRNLVGSVVNTQQQMQNDFNQAAQRGDMAAQEAIKTEYQNLNNRFLGQLKEFVRAHPKSPVSGYIIYTDMNNAAIPLTEVEQALSFLDKSMANTKFVKLATKRVNDIRGTTVGYTATNFTQVTPEGKKIQLSDFRGKYVLVDFWASWCRPCRMENPNVVAAYNRFKEKGFTVLGVSLDTNKDPWIAAIRQDNLTWTHVSDLKGWANEAGRLYNVTGIPQNFLIDKEGKIIAKDLRGAALDEKLAEILK